VLYLFDAAQSIPKQLKNCGTIFYKMETYNVLYSLKKVVRGSDVDDLWSHRTERFQRNINIKQVDIFHSGKFS
jgi:hypothetical protein